MKTQRRERIIRIRRDPRRRIIEEYDVHFFMLLNVESKIIEVMCSKKKEKKNYVEAFEVVIDKLRKKLEEEEQQLRKLKTAIALDNLLENQRSPLH